MREKAWKRVIRALEREKMLDNTQLILKKTRETLKERSAVEEITEGKMSAKFKNIDQMKELALDCRRCRLYKTRDNVVVGEGPENAKVVFIGEAPGADEDLQGRPFIGRSGKKLRALLQEVGIKESEIYITNIIKCRPPNNRNPQSDEIKACEPYLHFQLDTIAPRVICTLGTFASQWVLGSKERIGLLRGKVIEKDGMNIIATYHPSFILRNPGMTPNLKNDLEMVKEAVNNE
ncbi:uracil-DNA glycosylase [bacterium]|nr:uracil-DNA glycosylase [bacterium]